MITIEKATYAQLARLLAVVEKKENRNWDWLIGWLNGKWDDVEVSELNSVESIVILFEQDNEWQYYPHG
jgi:hypothetical protein